MSAGLCGQCSPESSDGFPPASLTAFLPELGQRGRWRAWGSIARTLVFRTQRPALRTDSTECVYYARCLSFCISQLFTELAGLHPPLRIAGLHSSQG